MKATVSFIILVILAVIGGCSTEQSPNQPPQSSTSNTDTGETSTTPVIPTPTPPRPSTEVNEIIASVAPSPQQSSSTDCKGNQVEMYAMSYSDGQSVNITIMANPQDAVFGYGLYLFYNPAVLKFRGYTPDEFLGKKNEIDVQATSIRAGTGASGGKSSKVVGWDVIILSHTRKGKETGGVFSNTNVSLGILTFDILSHVDSTILEIKEPVIFMRTAPNTETSKASVCWPEEITIRI